MVIPSRLYDNWESIVAPINSMIIPLCVFDSSQQTFPNICRESTLSNLALVGKWHLDHPPALITGLNSPGQVTTTIRISLRKIMILIQKHGYLANLDAIRLDEE